MTESSSPAIHDLVAQLRVTAAEQGFIACGIAPAVTSQGFSDLVRWLEAGYAAEMEYFASRLDAYRHPEGVLPGARSVITLAYPYAVTGPADVADDIRARTGRVARYTFDGTDYHDVIHPKLKRLGRMINSTIPAAKARGVVDTAPLMEREIASLAGLGWRGKNTLLLSRSLGSYFFLACLLVDIELPVDAPHETYHCGSCTACLDACPTDAFVGPHVLDASRCISYLTIESRAMIPEPLREKIGEWVFGCDVCQEVCPWNRKPTQIALAAETSADLSRGRMDLTGLFGLDEDRFREQFRHTPMWRTRRRGLLRNAAIVLGNVGDIDALEPLGVALRDDEPIVRASAVWAVKRILQRHRRAEPHQGRVLDAAHERLRRMVDIESDFIVREELADLPKSSES